jgi:hypothetical protein
LTDQLSLLVPVYKGPIALWPNSISLFSIGAFCAVFFNLHHFCNVLFPLVMEGRSSVCCFSKIGFYFFAARMTDEIRMFVLQQTMHQNEALFKENKSLKKKVHHLEKALAKLGIVLLLALIRQLFLKNFSKMEFFFPSTDSSAVHNLNGYSAKEDDVPHVQLKSSGNLGMLEYPLNASDRLVQTLVGVTPKVATTMTLPGLPAFLLFMAVRYTDQINNEKAVKELLSNTKTAIQTVLKKKGSGMEHFAMWLLNGLRLVDLMKQYSGDEKLQAGNTAKQNQHVLRQFDLSAFRQPFEDLCVSIYRSLVTFMQRELKDDAG